MENLFLLCFKIFFGRIFDVSLATVRTILTIKGKHLLAALFGFVELSLWFTIVQEALNSASGGIWIVLSYAGGFAAGTYLGGKMSALFIKGYSEIRAVTTADPQTITQILRTNGFGVTAISVIPSAFSQNQTMLLIQANRKEEKRICSLIHQVDPKAFLSVDETKFVYNGFFKK